MYSNARRNFDKHQTIVYYRKQLFNPLKNATTVSDTSRKEHILQLIQSDPFISQQALAEQCGLSRSAVAGHIANLIREGQILGRAYLLPSAAPSTRPVLCIGGANIDRKLKTLADFALATSNPVSQFESFGGVARNIAENLARLGQATSLISAFGDDASGRALQAHARSVQIDLDHSLQVAQQSSDSYTAVLNQAGEMLLALAHMQLIEQLDANFLRACEPVRQQAAMIIADMNLPPDSIALLLSEAQLKNIPLTIVAVSQPKMARLPHNLQGLSLLLLNCAELETRVGAPCQTAEQLASACAQVQAQGAQQLIVTLGEQGVCYTGASGLEFLAAPKIDHIHDVTGAGDAFSAAVCWSLLQTPQDLTLACRRGLTLAALTLQCSTTVCPVAGAQCLALDHLL